MDKILSAMACLELFQHRIKFLRAKTLYRLTRGPNLQDIGRGLRAPQGRLFGGPRPSDL